jgi:hypothetical protein
MGVCGRTHWFDKIAGSDFGRRGSAAAVRSEAQDERASPAASNPTLSATQSSLMGLPFETHVYPLVPTSACQKYSVSIAKWGGEVLESPAKSRK